MHNLIVGNSNSGKSNLAKRFAADMEKQGAVIVYDPLKSKGWPVGAEKFASPEKFLQRMETAESAFVFVDEARTLWEFDHKRADQLLYKRRHQGLLIFLIAQRAKMVPPNARNQCSSVFVFKQQKEDSETLGQEYEEDIQAARKLDKNHFIYSDGFMSKKLRLNYDKGLPPTAETVEGLTTDTASATKAGQMQDSCQPEQTEEQENGEGKNQ